MAEDDTGDTDLWERRCSGQKEQQSCDGQSLGEWTKCIEVNGWLHAPAALAGQRDHDSH